MNTFVNVDKSFAPDSNFWDLNPHFIYVKPFSEIYANDESKNKIQSSKTMWCILWMSDPDEEVNKYYRLPYNDRLEVCKEYHSTFDVDDTLVGECMSAYEYVCLTSIERILKEEKDALMKRAQFLRSMEYNMDTMKALDEARAKSPQLWKNYEKAEKDFLSSKKQNPRVYGKRNLTLREQGGIIAPED